jgi:hypothetical protein
VGGRQCFWSIADSYYRTMQGVMFVYDANAETLSGAQAMYARMIAKHACCSPALVASILGTTSFLIVIIVVITTLHH